MTVQIVFREIVLDLTCKLFIIVCFVSIISPILYYISQLNHTAYHTGLGSACIPFASGPSVCARLIDTLHTAVLVHVPFANEGMLPCMYIRTYTPTGDRNETSHVGLKKSGILILLHNTQPLSSSIAITIDH